MVTPQSDKTSATIGVLKTFIARQMQAGSTTRMEFSTTLPEAAITGPTLSRFNLNASHIASLPPEIRDRILEYLQVWGIPAEQLDVVQILRQTHGPLLFLLDYQALAALASDDPDQALEIIERRQRRGATIASQAI